MTKELLAIIQTIFEDLDNVEVDVDDEDDVLGQIQAIKDKADMALSVAKLNASVASTTP